MGNSHRNVRNVKTISFLFSDLDLHLFDKPNTNLLNPIQGQN